MPSMGAFDDNCRREALHLRELSTARLALTRQGGNLRTTVWQTTGTYSNALFALDVGNSWTTPAIQTVTAATSDPHNPPAVALGALWPSADNHSLLAYGGSFSDSPNVAPDSEPLWSFDTAAASWSSVNAAGSDVLRASEGAAEIVPDAGTSGEPAAFYAGGHRASRRLASARADGISRLVHRQRLV